MTRFCILLILCIPGRPLFTGKLYEKIPINFAEYGIIIYTVPALGDTLYYSKSITEKFKLVFSDYKGECYCERYMNGSIIEKGSYVNSLDTLKRYVSGRAPGGQTTSVRIQKYFQPLKNGDWFFYNKGKKLRKEIYDHGVLIK